MIVRYLLSSLVKNGTLPSSVQDHNLDTYVFRHLCKILDTSVQFLILDTTVSFLLWTLMFDFFIFDTNV